MDALHHRPNPTDEPRNNSSAVNIKAAHNEQRYSSSLADDSAAIGTKEAADRLGISPSRVLHLINSGRLPAWKIGYTWVIDPKDLQLVKDRKPGWKKGRKRK